MVARGETDLNCLFYTTFDNETRANETDTEAFILAGLWSRMSEEFALFYNFSFFKDYSNEAIVRDLPYGYEYTFQVALIYENILSLESEPFEPIDTRPSTWTVWHLFSKVVLANAGQTHKTQLWLMASDKYKLLTFELTFTG
jgi:hypothetical protein